MMGDDGASASVTLSFAGADVTAPASEALAIDALDGLAVSAISVLAVSLVEPIDGKTASVVV